MTKTETSNPEKPVSFIMLFFYSFLSYCNCVCFNFVFFRLQLRFWENLGRRSVAVVLKPKGKEMNVLFKMERRTVNLLLKHIKLVFGQRDSEWINLLEASPLS
jgi:hypothetical protein